MIRHIQLGICKTEILIDILAVAASFQGSVKIFDCQVAVVESHMVIGLAQDIHDIGILLSIGKERLPEQHNCFFHAGIALIHIQD